MITHVAIDAIRYRSHYGSGYGDFWIFSWLWRQIRWWSIPVYGAGIFLFGFIRALLPRGRTDDLPEGPFAVGDPVSWTACVPPD